MKSVRSNLIQSWGSQFRIQFIQFRQMPSRATIDLNRLRQEVVKRGSSIVIVASMVASMTVSLLSLGEAGNAQSEIRSGVLPAARFAEWEQQAEATLSTGVLADLETDPYFEGDYAYIYDLAANILSGYTVVNRAGYFPENAGIPREQQLAVSQAVYYFYLLPNRNGLILYRTPAENTARYILRKPGAGFLLAQ